MREWPWLYYTFRFMLYVLYRLWCGLRVSGQENIPDSEPFLAIANHESFLDPPLVGACTHRRLRYLARSSLWRQPVFGQILDRVGAMPIDRDGADRASIRRVLESLDEGIPVVVFPEGTRGEGPEVAEFRRGVMLFLRQAKVPVLPVGIRGTGKAWPKGGKWIRPARIAVRFGAMISSAEAVALGPAGLRRVVQELRDQA